MQLDNAIGTGAVWHRRAGPKSHDFRYQMYFSLLDLDQLEATFTQSRLWSLNRFNLVTLRRSDYIAPFDRSIAQAVRDRVRAELGVEPSGRIRMLTHLRQWGVCFNPVTFYFCEHADRIKGDHLIAIVAEVHNTPWNERHAYVLDARTQTGPDYRFEFDKAFHVSPFLPMDMRYDWRFKFGQEQLGVHMLLIRQGTECFRSGMQLALAPINRQQMRWMPLRFPFLTLKVMFGIYWQAARLWIKGNRFHPHPDTLEKSQ